MRSRIDYWPGHNSSAECNKVVSDIFGEFEFLMKYRNMDSYAHFAPFLKALILLISEILRKIKNGVKSIVSVKIMYQSLDAIRSSSIPSQSTSPWFYIYITKLFKLQWKSDMSSDPRSK